MSRVGRIGIRRNVALIAGALIVAALGIGAVLPNPPARPEDASLRARIQRLEDEMQIRDLLVQYGQYLDTRNFLDYSRLFARQGEWTGQLGTFTTVKGPEAIRAAMEKAFADRKFDPAHVDNVHVISNVRIEVGDDRATGYSKWTVLSRNGKDEPYVRLSGHYDDVYVREDGLWKFQSRSALRDIP
jgi:3-phenylpropionate/cinnamic acid dioxygenase small subunit